ncbi:MAG: prolyl oligopeptidase family serine peptidase [Lentisphaerota bacterium]
MLHGKKTSEEMVLGFSAWSWLMPDGRELLYRFHCPYSNATEKFPLVVHFHGAGSRGNDNLAQLRFAKLVLDPALNREECFVFAPQCPPELRWVDTDWSAAVHQLPEKVTPEMGAAITILDEIIANYPIDMNRIYIYGQSMGAFATWDLLCRRPEMFAAAVPVCGGGDENYAASVIDVPIWASHGALDQVVKVERSRNMIAALLRAGGTPHYTEFPDIAHNAWDYSYTPELFQWMFTQRKL